MSTDTLTRRTPALAAIEALGRQGLIWHASRRPAETCMRDALEAISAWTPRGERCQQRSRSEASRVPGAGAARLAALLLILGVLLAIGRTNTPSCEPITYTFLGSPPEHAIADFRLATEEIHRRTGLLFEEGARETSKLRVSWSDLTVVAESSPALVSDRVGTRTVGFGEGHWLRVYGGRQLHDATIDIEARFSWPLGMHRGDGLASAFVHELGHVIGLPHSPEPGSFMHYLGSPQPPTWTTEELHQLAHAGRQSGCRPPQSG